LNLSRSWPALALAATLTAAPLAVHAQAASAPARPAPAPSSPAKKALVQQVLQLQQPGIDAVARQLVEQPAGQMLQRAASVVAQRVPADQREATMRELTAEARKYVDETYPVVRDRAAKLAPTTVGALLEERFTEDELKQVVAMLKSPVYRKLQESGIDLQRVLAEKLVAETRATIEPKLRALDDTMVKRLGLNNPPPAAGSAPARP
jgi:uncharacterized protein